MAERKPAAASALAQQLMTDKRSKGRVLLGVEDDDEEEVKIPPQTVMISTGGDGQIASQRRPLDR